MAGGKQPKKMTKGKQVLLGLVLAGGVIVVLAAINGGGQQPAPAGAPAPVDSPVAAPASIVVQLPKPEAALIRAVSDGRRAYASGANDMAKGAARPERAKAVCAALPSLNVAGWRGTVETLSTNGDGKGILGVRLAPHVTVSTTNNDLSDAIEHTLIAPGSALFKAAIGLHEGEAVVFSGQFLRSATDCIEEDSVTLEGSIDDPDYSFRFSGIRPAK